MLRRLPRLAQRKDRAIVAPQHVGRLGRRHKSLIRQILAPLHDHFTKWAATERRVRLGRAKPRAPHKTNGTILQALSQRCVDFGQGPGADGEPRGEAERRLLLGEDGPTDHARDGHTKPSSCSRARYLSHQRLGSIEFGHPRLVGRVVVEGLRAKHERA